MLKKNLFLIGCLLLCSGCVSRTTVTSDSLDGTKKEVIRDKELIWFWDKDF